MARRFIFTEGLLEAVAAGPLAPDGGGHGRGSAALLLPCGDDDAPAIRRALEEHGCVRLAPGAFTLGAPLAVPPGRTLAGSGADHTTLRVAHAAGPALALAAAKEAAAVEMLMLVAPPGSPGDQHGVAAGAVEGRLVLRGLEIRGFGGCGVRIDGAGRVEMENVEVYDVGGDGVAMREVDRAWAARVRVHGVGGCGVRVAARGIVRLTELDVAAASAGLAVDAGPGRVIADALRLYGCDAELRIDPGADVVLGGRVAGR